MKIYSSLVFIIIILVSCSGSKNLFQNRANGPNVELYKGACFGECPVFRLSVYPDGTALYEGQRFTDRMGFYTRQLSEMELTALTQNLSNMHWDEYENYYESQLPDLAMTMVEHGNESFKFREEAPLELKVLSKLLNQMANQGEWEKIGHYEDTEDYMTNEFIITGSNDADISQIMGAFPGQTVKLKKKVSDHLNTWLVSYDNQKITPGQVYYAFISHPDIENVEYNVQLKLRDEN